MITHPAAMLVVELQNDLCAPSLVDQKGLSGALARAVARRGVLANLAPVLTACRASGVPVLYATKERHPGAEQPTNAPIYRSGGDTPKLIHATWGAQVVDEVAPLDGDIMLARFTSIDPSHGSELWETLARLGTRTLIVAGISTTFAVEGTVRAAANRGYAVIVLEDCCAGAPEEWHRFSADNVLPLLAHVTSAASFVAAL